MADAAKVFGEEKPKRAKPMNSWLQVALYMAGGYVLLCVLLFFLQNRLVFPGTKADSLKPSDAGFGPQQALELEAKTSDGVTLRGWHITGGRTRAKGDPQKLSDAALVVLFFTGNAGNRGDRMPSFRTLNSLGAHVACFDYRGYGDSDGTPSEEGFAKDARAAWDYLIAQKVPPERVVIHGESIGGAVAIRLASELCAEGVTPGGLVTEATFTRLSDVAARQYWFVPVGLLLRSTFPSIERIEKVTCPLLMFHGRGDGLVPFEHGETLFAKATVAEKTFVEIPNAGHNDVPFAHPARYAEALEEFYVKRAPEIERKQRERTKPRTPEEMKQKPKDRARPKSLPPKGSTPDPNRKAPPQNGSSTPVPGT